MEEAARAGHPDRTKKPQKTGLLKRETGTGSAAAPRGAQVKYVSPSNQGLETGNGIRTPEQRAPWPPESA